MKSMKIKIFEKKKQKNLDDSNKECYIITENSESNCSNMTNISIEDILTPAETAVTYNIPPIKKEKAAKENSIGSDNSETAVSSEYEMKKKKKKHKKKLGNSGKNISNVDLYTECAREKEDSSYQNTMSKNSQSDDQHNSKRKKKKSSVKDEQRMKLNDVDANSCSIFTSEFCVKSENETDPECTLNAFVNENTVKKRKKHKNESMGKKTKHVFTETNIRSENETDQDYDISFDSVSSSYESTLKKRKKRNDESLREKMKHDVTETKIRSENETDQDYGLNFDVSSSESTLKKNKKHSDQSLRKKSKYDLTETHIRSENETVQDYDINFDNVSSSNESTLKKKKKHSDQSLRKKSKYDFIEINIRSENETDQDYGINFDVSSSESTLKKRKKHNGESLKKKLKHDVTETNIRSENETDQEYDINFANVSSSESTLKKRKKHNDESLRKKLKHDDMNIKSENTSNLEYDMKFENVSSNESTPKKRKKNKDTEKKNKTHWACDYISVGGNVSGDGEAFMLTDFENRVNGKGNTPSCPELNDNDRVPKTKKSPKAALIPDSVLNILNNQLDKIVEDKNHRTRSQDSEKVMQTLGQKSAEVAIDGISSRFEENSSDFISSTQVDEDIKANRRKRKSAKKAKKKLEEECNRINQDATLAIGDFSDISEKDSSVPELKMKDRKKNNLTDFISSSLMLGLTSQLDKIIQEENGDHSITEPRKRSQEYNKISGTAEKSASSPELNGAYKTKGSTTFIPDSVLDMLQTQFDEIVDEDEKNRSCSEDSEKILKKWSRKSGEVNIDDNNRKQKIQDKRRILELLKETKSVERITEELNMNDDDDVEKLAFLNFTMPMALPQIHKIACNVGYHASPEQRRRLDEAGIKLKVGKYSREEDEKIIQNWKLFCKHNNWDEEKYKPFVKGSTGSKYGVLDKRLFRKFVEFISHNFEDRLMYNIYHRFQRLFTQNDIDFDWFTPEDDEIIMEYVLSKPGGEPFADLAVLLKRPRLALLKRYKRLQTEKLFDNEMVNWDEELSRKLVRNILVVTKSRGLYDLIDRNITGKEWEKIAKKMRIPADKIRRVWVIDFYARLINPLYDEQYDDMKYKLVDVLSKYYTDWREIDWRSVAKKFGGSFSYNRLYKMFNDMSRKVPREHRKDLKACLEYLKDVKFKKVVPKYGFIHKIFEEMSTGKMELDCDEIQSTK